MRKTVTFYLGLAFLPAVVGGCALGFSKSLFVTKSNLGFDIDTRPPTAEIGIARREVAITPAFEGGHVLPLFASFGTTQDGFDRFAYGLSSLFAGGEAAVALAKSASDAKCATTETFTSTEEPKSNKAEDVVKDDEICLTKPPYCSFWFCETSFPEAAEEPEKGEVRPFVFGTDTTFGVKLAWSGLTAQYPDSFKLGFHRKEMALAPINLQQRPCKNRETLVPGRYVVKMSPFVAALLQEDDVPSFLRRRFEYFQGFATGTAANKFARSPFICEFMKGMFKPEDPPLPSQ